MVADTDTGAPTAALSAASASARRGPSFGRLPIDLHGGVADVEAGRAHPPGGLLEQGAYRRRRPTAGSAVPNVRAEVAQAGRGESGVAERVRGDVGVGVALEPLGLVGPGQAGQDEGGTPSA